MLENHSCRERPWRDKRTKEPRESLTFKSWNKKQNQVRVDPSIIYQRFENRTGIEFERLRLSKWTG